MIEVNRTIWRIRNNGFKYSKESSKIYEKILFFIHQEIVDSNYGKHEMQFDRNFNDFQSAIEFDMNRVRRFFFSLR